MKRRRDYENEVSEPITSSLFFSKETSSSMSPSESSQTTENLIDMEQEDNGKMGKLTFWDSSNHLNFCIKRQKSNLTHQQFLDLSIIMEQVIIWLAQRYISESLPQTKQNLMDHLSKFQIIYGYIDVKIVYYHLIFNSVILLDENNEIAYNHNYDRNKPLMGFVPIHVKSNDDDDGDECGESLFSMDFSDVLKNSIEWLSLHANEILPNRAEEFLEFLKGFCVVKREADIPNILNGLIKKDYIQFREEGGEMSYSLPEKYCPRYYMSHYDIPQ